MSAKQLIERVTQGVSPRHLVEANAATTSKDARRKSNSVPTMWELEKSLRADGLISDNQALSFFCPVYFHGQTIVTALLNKIDEHGEKLLFSLPTITNPDRIRLGLREMTRLGIPNPAAGPKGLRIYSSLPGIEGIGSKLGPPPWVAGEFVQYGSFQIVPTTWLNAGDPVNESYKFPGETGYSPFWRIPTFEELGKMRPDLVKKYKTVAGKIMYK